MKNYKLYFYISLALFALTGILYAVQQTSFLGLCISLGFLSLSLGVKHTKTYQGLSFTMVILACVCITLNYPQYFIEIGGFKLKGLITPLIQIIMFGMGTEIGLQDFKRVAEQPKAVFIGLVGHFTFMPLMGFALATLFNFEPEIAAGIVLIGSMPCGLASNVMSYLAKANLALSVTLTSVSTILATFLTPFLMKILGGQFIEIKASDMFVHILQIVIVPIVLGLLFNKYIKGKTTWLDKLMPSVSMFGIATIIIVITAAGSKSLLTIGPLLILVSFIHNTSGYLFGYWFGRVFKLGEKDCRTIAIEVGMQNGGLASGLAEKLGKAATMGLAPAVFGPFMNITGSILASYWHKREPKN
jgi:BASS family bile acid:Na+ symporter